MNQKVFNWLLIILTVGILTCLVSVALTELSSKESTLLGIVLTILSFIASWVVSKYFADKSHKQAIDEVKEQHYSNLRTYALNAAEKVNNLSNELGKLSVYLQQELEEDGEELTVDELYLSSYERIESAVHIINTLKSVNDTYLSDWKGVIGEELDEKLEEQQERENELKELVQKVEQIIKNKPNEHLQSNKEVETISKEINELRKELKLTLNGVSGTFVRTGRTVSKGTKENVQAQCPHCNSSITYRQRRKESSFKLITCRSCSQKLAATWRQDKGFTLSTESLIDEPFDCRTCKSSLSVQLGNFPGSKVTSTCTICGEVNILARSVKGISIQKAGKSNCQHHLNTSESDLKQNPNKIDEILLDSIKNLLPPQPWPKGTHVEVSEKLKIRRHITSFYINELIRRGHFKPQIDGVLYEPVSK